ncbi:MAG: DUF3024 domain-containing protein [Chromatiales bacterium]|nr:DUF3024 domain-containing protein [Chromatiales bacterium]
MAISEFELKRCEKALEQFLTEQRPPAHMRSQVDLGYRMNGPSVEIFEVRPGFRDPDTMTEIPVAKTTHVKSRKVWKVYWMRQDLKRHGYAPAPEVPRFEDFLNLVREDAQACFFG